MSSGDSAGVSSRAAARGAWPMRLVTLGSQSLERVDRSTTPEERVAMVWALTVETWALAGRPVPSYPRAATPLRIRHLDHRRPETPA